MEIPLLAALGAIGLIAAALVVGVVAGARLAHAIAMPTLERIVSVVLVVTGAFLLARLAVTLATA